MLVALAVCGSFAAGGVVRSMRSGTKQTDGRRRFSLQTLLLLLAAFSVAFGLARVLFSVDTFLEFAAATAFLLPPAVLGVFLAGILLGGIWRTFFDRSRSPAIEAMRHRQELNFPPAAGPGTGDRSAAGPPPYPPEDIEQRQQHGQDQEPRGDHNYDNDQVLGEDDQRLDGV